MTEKKIEGPDLKILHGGSCDIYLVKEKRFGHWSVSFQTGVVPPTLQGSWQDCEVLIQKVEYYLANRAYNKLKVKLSNKSGKVSCDKK